MLSVVSPALAAHRCGTVQSRAFPRGKFELIFNNRMEPKMRLTGTFAILGFAAFVVLMPSAAHAAWCSNSNYGADNCGFPSFQSCLESIRGVGGACTQSRD